MKASAVVTAAKLLDGVHQGFEVVEISKERTEGWNQRIDL